MDKSAKAQLIALIATGLHIISGILIYGIGGELAGNIGGVILLAGLICTFISYCFGGLGSAIKIAFKIGVAGWIVVPVPLDIFTGICTFLLALLLFLFVPIIPVRKSLKAKQEKADYQELVKAAKKLNEMQE